MKKKINNKVFCLENVNVAPYVSNKMGLSYLDWAFVVKTLRTIDPNAHYEVTKWPVIDLKTRQVIPNDHTNYHMDINGSNSYVEVTVYFRGHKRTEQLQTYNFKGQSVQLPDGNLVNKTIKRCATKAAAELTGLGINLYINGKANGGSNSGRYSNRQYHSYRSSSNRYHHRSSSSQQRPKVNSNKVSQKQTNYINYLLSKTNSDGTMKYDYLTKNRNNLNQMSKQQATNAVKYLIKLQNYQKKHKSEIKKVSSKKTSIPNQSSVKDPKQTTLLQ